MFRFAGLGLVGFLALAVWIYCVFDVIASEEVLVRNLPKMVWLLIVLFIPTVGAVAWLALGRPLYAGWRPGDTGGSRQRRVLGPEDRSDFAQRPRPSDDERLKAWEADLQRREEELRGKDRDEGPAPS